MQKQSHHHAATKDDWTIEWTEEAIDAVQACIWLHVHIPFPSLGVPAASGIFFRLPFGIIIRPISLLKQMNE